MLISLGKMLDLILSDTSLADSEFEVAAHFGFSQNDYNTHIAFIREMSNTLYHFMLCVCKSLVLVLPVI